MARRMGEHQHVTKAEHELHAGAPNGVQKAVILARGLGKRMRLPDPSTHLATEQIQAADAGFKAMMPLTSGGRPFLDYVLSALADAGVSQICLVVAPEHHALRAHYASLALRRIEIDFAVQEEPLGTANAVLAAETFVRREPFLVLNSDNYYPGEVFRSLRNLAGSGVAAFDRDSLIREGNIPRERIRGFALLEIDADGFVRRITEKPSGIPDAAAGREVFVSMNCWRFDPDIFEACRRVPRSIRGEFELPEAVQFAIDSFGMRIKAVPCHVGVLDLTHRSDISAVAKRLTGIPVEL